MGLRELWEVVEAVGVDPVDIDMVMSVCRCSYPVAVKALIDNDNNVVNAVMDLPVHPVSQRDGSISCTVSKSHDSVIELVIREARCSYASAVKALEDNDNDIVNAIMELTM